MSDNLPTIRVVAAEIRDGDTYLITRRSDNAVLPGLWEFPGGRVREGESDREALERAVEFRIGVKAEIGEPVLEVPHTYRGYVLVLTLYQCKIDSEPQTHNVADFRWVHPDAFSDYEFPDADQRTVDALLSEW
jgi:8-oxo-dGTP diphosphatase